MPRDKIAEKVRRAADVLGIGSELGKRPKQLSGGQRQRVALGRAIVREPRCFLFDEPLSNLDAKLRVEMRAEIKRLHTGLGLTSIYVTHDQGEALSLSDRIVVMRDGRVLQVGAPAEIHDRPQNLFVADFVGYRNVVPLTVTKSGVDGVVLGEGAGLTLCGRSALRLAPGTRVLAAMRPEDLRLTEAPPGLNVARGTVRLIEYQGREYDVEVALDAGVTLKARLPHAVNIGSGVSVTIDAERVVILPAEDGA
jgi:putative spermidine/putrescine transport system ATP-binding protein